MVKIRPCLLFLAISSIIFRPKQKMYNTDNATVVYVSLFLIKPQNSLDISNQILSFAGGHADWVQHWKVPLSKLPLKFFWLWFRPSCWDTVYATKHIKMSVDIRVSWQYIVNEQWFLVTLFHMHTHRKTSLNHSENFHIVFAKAKHFSFQDLLKMHFTSVLDCYSRGFFVSSVLWDGAFLLNDVFALCSVSF